MKSPVDHEDAKEINIPFWSENPNILFHPQYLYEFFPTMGMSYSQRLNAVSRMVVILTILALVFSGNPLRTAIFGLISLASVYFMYRFYFLERERNEDRKKNVETFESTLDSSNSPAIAALTEKGKGLDKTKVFDVPTSKNPFSNVLVSDYGSNPNKLPAPPAYNASTKTKILESAKQAVVEANPGQPDIADKLFKDLGEQFVFEQSLRPFYSTAITTIPNDQEAFSDFCYGSMISCKEGNMFACARNMSHRQTMM